MNQVYIGCGGWAYADFGDSPGTQLDNYAKLFNFVEVNSTFYSLPKITQCERWRNTVPADFSFAVKCNRGISHLGLLKPSNQLIRLLKKMTEICKKLEAIALIIQTPNNFLKKPQNLKNANDLFTSIESSIDLVWEIRGYQQFPQLQSELKQILTQHNISHCTDISKDIPLYTANLAYTRLFGQGEQNMWQFDDNEIKQVHNKVENLRKEKKVAVTFHTMRMERDTARYQEFSNNNVLIPTTDSIGLESIMDVLKEYNKFPITKKELLDAHGWKLIDLTPHLRIRASKLLNKLPNTKYTSFQFIEDHLRNILGQINQKKLDHFF